MKTLAELTSQPYDVYEVSELDYQSLVAEAREAGHEVDYSSKSTVIMALGVDSDSHECWEVFPVEEEYPTSGPSLEDWYKELRSDYYRSLGVK